MMLFAAMLAAAPYQSFATPGDDYAYIHGQCLRLDLSHSTVHWGIPEEDCQELLQADAKLNRLYRLTAKTLTGTERETLRASELSWIKQKNATCKLSDVGLIDDDDSAKCFLDQVKMRIEYLRGVYGSKKR